MTVFYLFNEYGVCCGTTTDEDYASTWADANEGYYCCDQSLTLIQQCVILSVSNEREASTMRIDVKMTCPFCGGEHSVEVNLAGFEAWRNGELIQRVMPDLTSDEREQLISGLCPKCQAKMFGV